MSTPTRRQIEKQVNQLAEQSSRHESGNLSVLWGAADPERRPDGMTWVPETNTLTYDLWDAQRDALDTVNNDDVDLTAFLAGYGSGKTLFGARWIIKQAIEYPGSRFLVMGIDFQKARDTTFRVLFEQLPGERTGVVTSSYNGPEASPIVDDYNRQNHRLTLVNDTVIKLGSADRWNRYAGDEYGGVWCDEPSHYNDLHNLLEMLGSRLRGVQGPKAQLWTLTGNGQNDAFDILERGVDDDGDTLGLNIETIRASTLQNPYLDDADKERFERQYGNTSREGQALHGGFAAGGGNLLSRDQLAFIDAGDLGERNFRFRLGVDLAYVSSKRRAKATDSDYTAVVCAAVDPQEKRAYLIDVARERGLTLRESLGFVSRVANTVPNPTVMIEDVGAQTWFIQEARESVPGTIEAVTPSQSKEERIQDMSILFERGDATIVNREVDDNLGYDPRWRSFVREWVQFGSDGNSPDLLDAAYYALHNLKLGDYGQGPQVFSGSYKRGGEKPSLSKRL